jgi:uncharacterized membrane protein
VRLAPVFLLMVSIAFAHQGKDHSKKPPAKNEKQRLEKINQAYLASVRPIFEAKCFDCHSDKTRYPFYYRVPGARQLIDRDISQSKRHIDMSRDFPFVGGHGSPAGDLQEIEEVLTDGSMPPWRYRILHRGSKVTDEEKKTILEWIKSSLQELSAS